MITMSPEEMIEQCLESIRQTIKFNSENNRTSDPYVTFVISKSPSGFPRGELLSETPKGKVYRFNAMKVVEYLLYHEFKGLR